MTRDLHSVLMEIENKEGKLACPSSKKAKHGFEQEIKSELCKFTQHEMCVRWLYCCWVHAKCLLDGS